MSASFKAFELLKLAQGRRRDAGEEIWGVLGDTTGNPNVPGQTGKSWVRFPAGSDNNGVQQYYPPVPIWEGVGASFLKKGGRRVWVGLDPMGVPEIKRGDRQDLAQVGITASVTNSLTTEGKTANPANPFLGLYSDAVSTAHSPTTKVTVYPLWYDNGTQLQYYPGTETEADKVDLASFIPIAGKYCYVVLWLDTDANDLETPTASTPATITSTFGNSDRIAALQECYAARPNANCIPITAYYLANAQTAVTQSKKHIDLRQMVNMPNTGGSSAPDDAKYILQVADGDLPNAQAMGALATGIVKNTTATGVQSIAAAGTDYTSPTGTENLSNKTITASSLVATALSLLIATFKGIFTHANTADRTYTLPDYDGTLATRAGTETLTNKTATSLVLNTGVSGTAIDTDITLTANSDTLLASQKATKSYTDAQTFKKAVGLATTAALAANTYANGSSGVGATITANANGALTIDGTSTVVGDRVLIKDEASAAHNGIYVVTATGSAGTPFILTRAGDSDTSAEIPGTIVFVYNGITNLRRSYKVDVNSAPTIGTTTLSFTRYDGANTQLSNLGTTAINAHLVGDLDNTYDLGSVPNFWRSLYSNLAVLKERSAPSTPSSTDYAVYAKSSAGGQLFGLNGAGVEKQISVSVAKLVDSKATTTQGGGSSAATWNARDLNTEQYDPDGIVTVSSNKFVLVAGDYEVTARSPVVGGTGGTAARNRIFNVTAATSVKEGIDIFAAASAGGIAIVTYKFTSNGTDEYRIDTYTSTAKTTNGLGNAVSDGSAEIYTEVEIKKVA